MAYALGIDVGTTHTAAAVWRDGAATLLTLAADSVLLPSVVFLLDDGSLLVGAEADVQGAARPERVARTFRAQLGDPVPRLLGDEEVSSTELVAALVEFVVAAATTAVGSPPDHVTLTCPASWGPHQRHALTRAAQHAGLTNVGLVTEPVATAVHYAGTESFPPGAHLLVYDLGGADLDVCVVTRTESGYTERGRAARDGGVGGEMFDDKVMDHVRSTLHQVLLQLDPDDADVLSGLWRMRRNAVAAKELLSTDTEAQIVVDLPGVSRRVRYTRGEFEAAIRPSVLATVDVVRRVLQDADLSPADVEAVLLTGGSSAVPLVSRLLGEVRARVVIDRQPKLAVALGAALSGAVHLVAGRPSEDAGDPEILALDLPTVRSTPDDVGITRPIDVALPTRPDPNLVRRPVVAEVFVYAPAPRGGLTRAVAVAGAVLVVVSVAVALAVGWPRDSVVTPVGGGVSGATAPAAAVGDGGQRPSAPELLTVDATTSIGIPGDQVTALLSLADGSLVAAGQEASTGALRVWQADPGGVASARAAPSVEAGQRGSITGLAVTGGVLVAVGWTEPLEARGDVTARRSAAWVTGTALDGGWQLVQLADVTELTAVTTDASGALVAAGVTYVSDARDGDAVVVGSPDGTQWTPQLGLGFDGPGPARITALAAAPAGIVAAVERRDGAVLRSALVRAEGATRWQEIARLDADGAAVAQVSAAAVTPDGRVVFAGGQRVGTNAGRALIWLAGSGAPVLAEVAGAGPLSAAAASGSSVLLAHGAVDPAAGVVVVSVELP